MEKRSIWDVFDLYFLVLLLFNLSLVQHELKPIAGTKNNEASSQGYRTYKTSLRTYMIPQGQGCMQDVHDLKREDVHDRKRKVEQNLK